MIIVAFILDISFVFTVLVIGGLAVAQQWWRKVKSNAAERERADRMDAAHDAGRF